MNGLRLVCGGGTGGEDSKPRIRRSHPKSGERKIQCRND